MEKIITIDNIRRFAYVNSEICKQPIRGIVVYFQGLNNRDMNELDPDEGLFYADQGVLYVIPYNNPWMWMNKQAVGYTNEIINTLFRAYRLPENLPIVYSGMSMGGLAALAYTVYAERTPTSCIANCPVCDAVYHFSEREDIPRTLYSALYNEPESIEDALKNISPLHLEKRMPYVHYHIFHCEEEKLVSKEMHSDRFVAQMRSLSHDVTYDTIPGRGHCNLTIQMKQRFRQYALEAIDRSQIMLEQVSH